MRLTVFLVGLLNSEPADSVNHILASYILNHLPEMVHMGLGDLAEQCQVSKATVSRFCRALGYRDFYELKYDCYELEGYVPSRIVAPGDSDRAFLQAVNQQTGQQLSYVSQKDLDRLAQALLRYENIAFMGHMESGDVALMLQHDFYCLTDHINPTDRPTDRIIRVTFRPLEQQQFFQSLREPTLVVVFSVEGRFFQRLFGANRAPKLPAGSMLCLLTSNCPKSPVPVQLHIDTGTKNDFSGRNLSLMLLEHLLILHCQRLLEADSSPKTS
ncbi:MAG: hypothetical protein LUG65_00100 [Clostridiales bacterium]|nr:hypothetical protein [Clostridiales bacterium]